jgi:hypothetical protein
MKKLQIIGEWLLVLTAVAIIFMMGYLMDRMDHGPYHVWDKETVSVCERSPL